MRKLLLYCSVCLVFGACSQSSGKLTDPTGDRIIDSIPFHEVEDRVSEIARESKRSFENDEFLFECSFIPSVKNLLKQELSGEALILAQRDYAQNSSFLLELQVKSFHDEMLKYKMSQAAEYYARIEYYSFHVQKDIRLIAGEDTLVCTHHHFERTYGISPNIRLNIQFPIPEKKLINTKELQVEFFDRSFGQGIVNFAIDPSTLNSYTVFNPPTE